MGVSGVQSQTSPGFSAAPSRFNTWDPCGCQYPWSKAATPSKTAGSLVGQGCIYRTVWQLDQVTGASEDHQGWHRLHKTLGPTRQVMTPDRRPGLPRGSHSDKSCTEAKVTDIPEWVRNLDPGILQMHEDLSCSSRATMCSRMELLITSLPKTGKGKKNKENDTKN